MRVDSGVFGFTVPAFYDSLLAKLVVDESREAATRRMLRALDEFQIEGIATLCRSIATCCERRVGARRDRRDLLGDPIGSPRRPRTMAACGSSRVRRMARIVEPPLPEARYTYGGDEFISCEIAEGMSFSANFKALAICQELGRRKHAGIIEICPANASYLVRLDPTSSRRPT